VIRANIVGASGYTGGELLRLLLAHPDVEIQGASSESLAGKPVGRAHPNLRGITPLAFRPLADLAPADIAFLCLPHGEASTRWDELVGLAPQLIDLSADFRLLDAAVYEKYYERPHPRPQLLGQFVYGLAELHRDAIRDAAWVACGGCNATASILGLYPLARAGLMDTNAPIIEVKAGSSEAGRRVSATSHHPERSGAVRAFAPTGHRHGAEISQALGNGAPMPVHLSITSVEMVRGAVATSHVFPSGTVTEREVWQIYREAFRAEPFMRLVKETRGPYRYPAPKLLAGTNFCDVGFELDADSGRLVVISAIDNLMKGAAGQAVQCMNLMNGLDETTGLSFPGLHPS
jgi:N-acetyl-gamma-glutamyl-phosphate/LysW-gamma-L-alpha-aminoadipyl-6-phosphate reductase